MRIQLLKKHYTKAERIFGEMLKRERIAFKAKQIILGKEIDFLVGNLAIEINGHPQKSDKNKILIENGFYPVNFPNYRIFNELEEVKKDLWRRITQQTSVQ